MMEEDLRIKITGDGSDAIAEFKKTRLEVLNTEKGLNTLGQQGKLTGKTLKDMAGVLGPEFSQLGGDIDKITGSLKDVNTASLAAKTGLIGVVATAGFSIGKMIGDWAFETEKWKKELADAITEFRKADAEIVAMQSKRMQSEVSGITGLPSVEQIEEREKAIVRVQNELAENNRRLREKEFQLEREKNGAFVSLQARMANRFFQMGQPESNLKQEIQDLEDRSKVLLANWNALQKINPEETQRVEAMAESARLAESEKQALAERERALMQQAAAQERAKLAQDDYLENLKLELTRIKEGEEAYQRLALAKRGFNEETIESALRLRDEINELKEIEAFRAAEARQSGGSTNSIGLPGRIQASEQRGLTGGRSGFDPQKVVADNTKTTAETLAEMKATQERMAEDWRRTVQLFERLGVE